MELPMPSNILIENIISLNKNSVLNESQSAFPIKSSDKLLLDLFNIKNLPLEKRVEAKKKWDMHFHNYIELITNQF